MTRLRPGLGRAWLITPATAAGRFPAAYASGAAVALADLEDSVAPARKDEARKAASAFLAHAAPGPVLGVRVNSPLTPDGIRDLNAIAAFPHRPALVLIPKVESPRDIELVASVLDSAGYAPQVWALVETPRAIEAMREIACAPRLGGVVFGAADYAARVGCGMSWEALLYARSVVATSTAAAGILAIDSPFFALADMASLRREAARARELGFFGKGAVHPGQVPVIEEAMAPTAAELARARQIAAAHCPGAAAITTVDGQMVGPPLVTAALARLAQAGEATSPEPKEPTA